MTTTDRIEHISEEKSLLQIFAKIVGILIQLPLTIRIRFAHMVFWDTIYPIEHIREKNLCYKYLQRLILISPTTAIIS